MQCIRFRMYRQDAVLSTEPVNNTQKTVTGSPQNKEEFMIDPIRIGISSCLLGNNVRYDGGHARDRFITQTLGMFAEYVPVCPEVECGMPVPREAVRLVGDPEKPRMVTQKGGVDKTGQMNAWIEDRLKDLEAENLCGFIFKSKSPSSGLYRIRVYGDDGKVRKNGTGLFARAFTERFPRIPVEEAGRLHDPKLREQFIENIFSLQRWRNLLETNRTLGGLVEFHTNNKLLILSHSPEQYRQLGKLVARGKQMDANDLFDTYEQVLLKALSLTTTLKKNNQRPPAHHGFFQKRAHRRGKTGTFDDFRPVRGGIRATDRADHVNQTLRIKV